MDYFAAMRAFVRSVDLGSFSKAAGEEGVKVSTVSRHVSALEADLGAALLNRSTRNLHLTEAGATFYRHAIRILGEVEEARTATTSLNQRPRGVLRINIPGAFGRRHVMPHLPDFLAAYPDISVDATLTDATVNLIETGTDVAIRIGTLADFIACGAPPCAAPAGACRQPRLSGAATAAAGTTRPAASHVPAFRLAADRCLVFRARGNGCGTARPGRGGTA